MPPTDRPTSGATRCEHCSDGLGRPREVAPGSWRTRVRAHRGTSLAWRAGVLVAGLICIIGGFALAVLPGPLTIPPVLLGLWIWSTEFDWARRSFEATRQKAVEAWRHARRHPVSSVAVTVGGLALVVAVVAIGDQFDVVERTRAAIGI